MTLTIYTHAGCTDGLFAARIIEDYHHNLEEKITIIPHVHNTPMLLTESNRVFFVDMVPSQEVLDALLLRKADIVIIDHHVGNQGMIEKARELGISIHFQLDACASLIAHRIYNLDGPLSYLVDYVDDRDRWTWAHPSSKEVTSAMNENLTLLHPKKKS